jgi:hypothetical protein
MVWYSRQNSIYFQLPKLRLPLAVHTQFTQLQVTPLQESAHVIRKVNRQTAAGETER